MFHDFGHFCVDVLDDGNNMAVLHCC
jgi:hypothetical protein